MKYQISFTCIFFLFSIKSSNATYEDGLGGQKPLIADEFGQERTDPPPGTRTVEQKIDSIMPFDNEEEEKGFHISSEHKCNACQAISHQLQTSLRIKQRHRGRKPLKDWEYLEVMEKVCNNVKVWDSYGLKPFGGSNVLQGPGLTVLQEDFGDPSGAPMFQMVATKKGGYWGHRLQQRCHALLGDEGEDEIFQTFIDKARALSHFLCNKMCTEEELENITKFEDKEEQPGEPKAEPPKNKKKHSKKKKHVGNEL
eukprot:CAMPEP_0196581226 /NCGR_PEP_ID=MMETSP1081-20130531/33016_1 /TAXON_ID=36882 /ORGANISM="Pyramimonas amylifera, Strain CCMP720" /LENGTH=253 /DNA_ID=CAMNT_0041901369 /DNA_START=23 /DNA_END=784 /DNA_ORIENTATION=+